MIKDSEIFAKEVYAGWKPITEEYNGKQFDLILFGGESYTKNQVYNGFSLDGYLVTTYGRVFSLKNNKFLHGTIVRNRRKDGTRPKTGYIKYYFSKECQPYAHRLVYYFFGKEALKNYNVIHHEQGKYDNRICSLDWCDNQSEHIKKYHNKRNEVKKDD